MKQLTLSNHANKKLNELQKERKQRDQSRLEQHEKDIKHLNEKINNKYQDISDAWIDQQYLLSVVSLFIWLFYKFTPSPIKPFVEIASQQENIWQAGSDGEELAESKLLNIFNDDWTLISGFHGYNGEVDQIMVGPYGVFAIEIKNINGSISCESDNWTKDKFDKYGNLVERDVPIRDKGGRSPSKQLNQSTQPIMNRLKQKSQSIDIYTIILLTHRRSSIGILKNQTVDYITHLSDFDAEEMLADKEQILSQNETNEIIETIKTLHGQYKQKRNTYRGKRKPTEQASAR